MLCPYCEKKEADSDDHIFPASLGGKRTIRSCKNPCNDTFGHSFEGAVISDLAPLIVLLRSIGVPSNASVLWRQALQIDGVDYDLNSDLVATPSTPIVKRDDEGKVVSVTAPTLDVAKRQAAKLEKKSGKQVRITEVRLDPLQLISGAFDYEIGADLRRLAIKTAFAAATLLGFTGLLDAQARKFLLNGIGEARPVRIDYSHRAELDALRPPLSHFAFVKGNGKTGRCYAIVQFFGTIQLYAILNDHEYAGPDFACCAFVELVTGNEVIAPVPLLSFPEAPRYISEDDRRNGLIRWEQKLRSEINATFPRAAAEIVIRSND